jgi:hypothetical protein
MEGSRFHEVARRGSSTKGGPMPLPMAIATRKPLLLSISLVLYPFVSVCVLVASR